MLKRLVAIFLFVLHLLSGTGIFADIHLCGGNVTNINVLHTDNDYKCACKTMANKNCCHDIQIKTSAETEGICLIPFSLKSASSYQLDFQLPTTSLLSIIVVSENTNGYLTQTNCRSWPLQQLMVLATTVIRS